MHPNTVGPWEALWRAHALGTNPYGLKGARTALHEVLHIAHPPAYQAPEGLVEAVAVDLAPKFVKKWTMGEWTFSEPYRNTAYPIEVHRWRTLSSFACEDDWWSSCAKAYRQHLLKEWKPL